MTYRNNQQAADSIASNMESVMSSDQHKELFKKTAQVPVGGIKAPQTSFTDPNLISGKHDPHKLTEKMEKNVPGGTMAERGAREKDLTGKEKGEIAGVTPASKPASTSVGLDPVAKLRDIATFGTGEKANIARAVLGGNPDAINENNAKLLGMPLLALQDAQSQLKTKAASLFSTIVKIANVLGENGFYMSEQIADNLLKSIIVEAKKKAKKEEEMEECEDDWKKGKKDKKAKKDKKC